MHISHPGIPETAENVPCQEELSGGRDAAEWETVQEGCGLNGTET